MLFLMRYWKGGVAAIILVAALGYVGYLKHEVTAANKETAAITQLYTELTVSHNSLVYAVGLQNDAIDKMAEDAKEQDKRIAKSKLDYNALQAKYNKDLKDLHDAQPNPNLSDCDNTRILIDRLYMRTSHP